ncbi:uncharacterized protein LOC131146772 isoform X2 [Malania oleifera]|uniref:uncharacterized protein LOC131146772 isoform X2 n=1 Tax=Malania oleifera TaxID=397392 RepID=UPI0025AE4E78|nr:uncharacterized protein LOC131146772 isoform X2 [Malania oleifera]
MEIPEEEADDQGSGWFQVKKKHRSNSKFSLQSWVGGFSGKHTSQLVHSRPSLSDKHGNLHGKHRSNYAKAGAEIAANNQGNVATSTSVLSKDEKDVHDSDKCMVDQDNECSKSSVLGTVVVTHSNSSTGDPKEIPQTDKPSMVHKIKWGDLEDDALLLHCEKTDGAETHFGDAGVDSAAVGSKSENAGILAACDPSCSESQENKLVRTSLDANVGPHQMPLLSCKDESFESNCKELSELSSKDVNFPIIDGRMVDLSNDLSNCTVNHEPNNDSSLSFSCPSGEKAEAHVVMSEEHDLRISEVSVRDGGNTVMIGQESDNIPETSAVSDVTTSVEGSRDLQDGTLEDDLSRVQFVAAIGEADAGEGKERFRQRLWCFLFENLNRAVDELYLLCELECDLEQMKEAILVLEEAASDFKELNSRVEEFENMKKTSSQVIDGVPMTMKKTDHRRPHALSWEVRRMTTSPHRAEILSSSLEAFKKIRQERAGMSLANDVKPPGVECPNDQNIASDTLKKSAQRSFLATNSKDLMIKSRKQSRGPDLTQRNIIGEKRSVESSRSNKIAQNGRVPPQNSSTADSYSMRPPLKDSYSASAAGKCKKEQLGFTFEKEKLLPRKDDILTNSIVEKNPKCMDLLKRQDKEKEMKNATSRKSMDAWKEKRNWEDILASPFRVSSRVSHSPSMNRRSAERARVLHDKLMSPEKKKKTALDLKKEAEEKHARAMRIRSELENERVQKLQRTSEKLNRVNEWQAVRSMKLREGMYARHQRSESRHEAFLAQVVRRAGDESSKVNEVRFITSLNEENKKLMLRQKLHDSELRRAEKLQVIKTKQKEDMAREEAVLERRKLIEAEKLQRLAETQRKKEEAQVRREEERKASSAAREAKAIEQLRRKEVRAKAQQEEAELLAQKLAERLSESEQRRKFYLEQIRERASMDFRDQSSPLLRRSLNRGENQGRSTPTNNAEDCQENNSGLGGSSLSTGNIAPQHSLKRRIKRIRQRLMALKHEFPEPPVGAENGGIGYRTAVGTARAKIGRWLQELQRLRQARKEGAASIGLITAEMIKFLEGKEPELHASRQAGLLDFIASALPASHTSKPEACQVTIYLLRLLRVVLSMPANRSYFLAQNLLPPVIPMLSAALENYIKIAASLNVPGGSNSLLSKSYENFESISEVLDGFLWTVTTIMGHISSDECQLQMQDGLLELVVVYQVIHRLRDLFALYDRPQVEGSPFPSSIILSIKLLTVLTSRPGTISSIDWESFPIETARVDEIKEGKCANITGFVNSLVNNSSGDPRTPLSTLNCSMALTLPDVPEDRPLEEFCPHNRSDESVFVGSHREKELADVATKSDSANTNVTDAPDEFQKNPIADSSNSFQLKKDENIMMDTGAGTKNDNLLILKQSGASLLSAMSETGLVCLPSLLTAVLLQANNKLSSEENDAGTLAY